MGAQGLVLFQIAEGSVLVFRVPVDQVFTIVDVLLMMADVLGGGGGFVQEANNLKGRNTFRNSGLVQKRTVGVEPAKDGKGVVLVTRKVRGQYKKISNSSDVLVVSVILLTRF